MILFKNWKKKFHDFYFGVVPKEEPLPEIKIGEIYKFQRTNEKDPFRRREDSFCIEVKDIEDGYVLYRHCISTFMCQNESCSIKTFHYMYQKK